MKKKQLAVYIFNSLLFCSPAYLYADKWRKSFKRYRVHPYLTHQKKRKKQVPPFIYADHALSYFLCSILLVPQNKHIKTTQSFDLPKHFISSDDIPLSSRLEGIINVKSSKAFRQKKNADKKDICNHLRIFSQKKNPDFLFIKLSALVQRYLTPPQNQDLFYITKSFLNEAAREKIILRKKGVNELNRRLENLGI